MKKKKPKINTDIQVTVVPAYISEQSDPENLKFTWSYEIEIVNNSAEIVQLLSRQWRVTDMTGKVDEINGAGVVGLQPLIKPGKRFTYTSFCQLMMPRGTMEGFYEMQNLEDELFQVVIPKFVLTAPDAITRTFRSRLH